MRLAAVAHALNPFLSHQACIAASYAALPSVVLGYGLCWSQSANWSVDVSQALPIGVVFVPMAGVLNRLRLACGVGWNGLAGLFWGWLSVGGLLCIGVCGIVSLVWYLGGGVPGSII